MEDRHTPEPSHAGPDDESRPPRVGPGIETLASDVLEYKPLVSDPLDLLIDMKGVVLGRSASFHRNYGQIGLGLIGAVSESSDDPLTSLFGMPVYLDLVSPHVLFVAGKRGAGKSYTLGIVVEELSRAMERREIEVAAVVIDTVDVFRQMAEPNTGQEDALKKWGLDARGIPISVYIPRKTFMGLPEEVRQKARLMPLAISPSELATSDWGFVLEKGGQLSTTMDNLIGDTIEAVRRGYTLEDGERVMQKPDFSIRDMIRCIEEHPSIAELYKPATRAALIQRLRRASRLGVFMPGGTSAQDLAVAGQVTVIDVAPLGSDAEPVLAVLTNMLCRQVLAYRMAWTEDGESAREELPATWLIVDEAQTLVPRGGTTPAKDAIVSYAKLGRRFGCSLILCTQQPSAVADEAISQADIVISHSLSHDADIRALQQRAPSYMPESFKEKQFISGLPRGAAMVFDQITENRRGFIMQVRPRISKHGGSDRLSALFEAASLLPSESPTEAEPSRDELELIEPEVVGSEEATELLETLPDVPRPPIKLSRADWEYLDQWIREYLRATFERRRQDVTITDEPSPLLQRALAAPAPEPQPDLLEVEVPKPRASTKPSAFDSSRIIPKKFGPVSPALLEKALTRIILYSKVSHDFLFPSVDVRRSSRAFLKERIAPLELLSRVVTHLESIGMTVNTIEEADGLSLVFMSKNGTRAVVAVGLSGKTVCVPVVITGSEVRTVNTLSDALRSAE